MIDTLTARIGVAMDATGWLGLLLIAWLVLSVPIALLVGRLIRHGQDGE